MASLSFSECKYDVREGRAEIVANLIKTGFEFTAIKTGEKFVVKAVEIDGTRHKITETNIIVSALKSKKQIAFLSKNNKMYFLSNIEKSNEVKGVKASFNAGDVAEGIFAIALAARFVSKDKEVKQVDLENIKKKIVRRTEKTSNAKFTSPNSLPGINDDVELIINLAKINLDALLNKTDIFDIIPNVTKACIDYCNSEKVSDWASVLYNNNRPDKIKIISDGIGDQKGSKMDVQVLATDYKGVSHDLKMNYSLKAGDVKQFGQVGGGSFEKQKKLWELFGVNISSIEKEFSALMVKDPKEAYTLAYKTASELFNKPPSNGKGKLVTDTITKQIAGDEDIVLVQLNKSAKIYDPKKLYISDSIRSEMRKPDQKSKAKDTVSIIVDFYVDEKHIFSVRLKNDSKTGGYVRNYIEKEKDLHLIMEN